MLKRRAFALALATLTATAAYAQNPLIPVHVAPLAPTAFVDKASKDLAEAQRSLLNELRRKKTLVLTDERAQAAVVIELTAVEERPDGAETSKDFCLPWPRCLTTARETTKPRTAFVATARLTIGDRVTTVTGAGRAAYPATAGRKLADALDEWLKDNRTTLAKENR